MNPKLDELIGDYSRAKEKMDSLVRKEPPPPSELISKCDEDLATAFDAVLAVRLSDRTEVLERIRFLISYLKESAGVDGAVGTVFDKLLEDTVSLVDQRSEDTTRARYTGDRQSQDMVELGYVSNATSHLSDSDIKELRSAAQSYNKQSGITGMLAYDQKTERIFQILEGPATSIDKLMGSISVDPRHHGIEVRFRGVVSERRFGRWSMCVTTSSELKSEISNVALIDEWLDAKLSDDQNSVGSIGPRWMNSSLREIYQNA